MKMPKAKCPTCSYEMDSATCIEDEKAKPRVGDLSICLNCGERLEFTEGLKLRLMPKDIELDWQTAAIFEKAAELIHKRGRFNDAFTE